MRCYKLWMTYTKNKEITQQLIYNYLIENKNRRNNLALFKLLYPEQTKDLKFPKRTFKPKFLPSEEQIQVFYQALPDKYKPIFLLLRESGLRISGSNIVFMAIPLIILCILFLVLGKLYGKLLNELKALP